MLLAAMFVSQGISAQSIKKTYKYLEKNEIEKADIELKKFSSEVKYSDEVILFHTLAGCIILCNEQTRNYDPYEALELFEKASKPEIDYDYINEFLGKYSLSIDIIKGRICSSILNNAKKINTEASYKKAVQVGYKCGFQAEVDTLWTNGAYSEAKRENTYEENVHFFTYHGNSRYTNDVKKKFNEFEFQRAKRINTLEALNLYINSHSDNDNPYLQEAISMRDSIIEENERKHRAMLAAKPKALKEAIFNTQKDIANYNIYMGSEDNIWFNNFPMKYYDGNQFFHKFNDNHLGYHGPWIINDSLKEIQLEHGGSDGKTSSIYLNGKSGKTERFIFYTEYILPSIGSKQFQDIDIGYSTYDNKKYLITKTYDVNLNGNNANSELLYTKLIDIEDIFWETQSVSDVEFHYGSRLSNNNILLILEVELEYLSHQLNSAFGVDGYGKISRVFLHLFIINFL